MTIRADIERRLADIAKRDGAFRSFVRVDAESALDAARAADTRRSTNAHPILRGDTH